MKNNWKEELEEYGELHSEFCDINNEGGSNYGCYCDNMNQIKSFIEKDVVEKLIEEIPENWDDNERPSRVIASIKQELRAKWLNQK